ncbi:MAG: isocitrate lyase/phosphoenolpyruvate mutase family protein [Proteobacteria bacterium]|nr:isocitrate lyase/phosphoenolpyruvate mutase family protein [Pseudomonadota bacterium]
MRRPTPVEAMSCHSPLSALVALEAGFPALWASGFELSALYGLPDAGLVSMTEHLEMTRRIVERTNALVIADLDTGSGNAVNAAHAMKLYASGGAACVVVEDKVFPKMTSLIPGGRQELIRVEEYQGKIAAMIEAGGRHGPIMAARTEALVAGGTVDEALERGEAYAEAGAELLLVHSKGPTSTEIEDFIARWSGACPLIIVPTAFPAFSREMAARSGKVGVMVYANHAVRASVAAMRQAFAAIRQAGAAEAAEGMIAPTADIFELQDMAELKRLEDKFLR